MKDDLGVAMVTQHIELPEAPGLQLSSSLFDSVSSKVFNFNKFHPTNFSHETFSGIGSNNVTGNFTWKDRGSLDSYLTRKNSFLAGNLVYNARFIKDIREGSLLCSTSFKRVKTQESGGSDVF